MYSFICVSTPPTRLLEPLEPRPLVIMPAWLLAKRKPLNKYADIYLPLGFDVLTVTISPWQLFWPAKGSQLVARDLISFLHHNGSFAPLLVHGFSVGAYVWGECLVHVASDPERYGHIVERIVGQVWDSAADITEIPVGVPKAVFPNNPRLNRALGNYMRYHLRTFYDIATQHYERSSHQFHNNMVRTPALMFVSEDDPVGSVSSNDCVRRDWQRLGIECDWKCWAKSEHVSHYMRHQREYLDVLYAHLDRLQLVPGCIGRAGEGVDEAAAELPKLRAKL